MAAEWMVSSNARRILKFFFYFFYFLVSFSLLCEKNEIIVSLYFQIHFHGKDMTSLHRHFDEKCLPSYYGGKVEIPDGTGVALGDLFRLYSKEFESE